MAKKKADAPSPTTKSPSGAKAKAANGAKPQAAKKAGNAKGPAATRALTSEEIGHVAGDVWRALADGGGQTVAALKKSVGVSDELVLAALGWLAREEKLAFETNGKSVTVSLA